MNQTQELQRSHNTHHSRESISCHNVAPKGTSIYICISSPIQPWTTAIMIYFPRIQEFFYLQSRITGIYILGPLLQVFEGGVCHWNIGTWHQHAVLSSGGAGPLSRFDVFFLSFPIGKSCWAWGICCFFLGERHDNWRVEIDGEMDGWMDR